MKLIHTKMCHFWATLYVPSAH